MNVRVQLRRKFRDARRALSAASQIANAESACAYFLRSGAALRYRHVGGYLPRPDGADGELDPTILLTRLAAMGKRLSLPVIQPLGGMAFYRYRPDDTTVLNKFAIPEPAINARYCAPLSHDLILAPLVAFDSNGNRLGMGGGYYDRYLAHLPTGLRPTIVGFAHEVQRSPDPLPHERWDVPLDAVLTEAGWQWFR